MQLTASQVQQLMRFIEDKRHQGAIVLRESPNLGTSHFELDLLRAEGKSLAKRVLFPV